MATHTKAPWSVAQEHVWHTDEATGMGYRFLPIDFPGGCLAWVSADDGDEEADANASLIAAAPELLEELRSLVFRFEHMDDAADQEAIAAARLAIAKAEGRAE